jgi:hypothetical protein
VTTERELKPAAHAHAVHRRDDRLAARLEREDHVEQVRLGECLRRAELADVRAAREGLAGAGDHDRLDGRIGERLVEAFDDAEPGRMTEAVHRRVVERDDGDVAAGLVAGGHAGPRRVG